MSGQDFTWLFDTERSDGGIICNGIESGMPDTVRGKSITWDFVIWESDYLGTVGNGFTYGGTHGATYGGSTGGTYGSTDVALARYNDLRDYVTHAGAITVDEQVNGKPVYSEHLATDAAIDSLVVPVEPGADYTGADGLWVAITGGQDLTRIPQDMARVELQTIALADLGDYADRTAIQNDLEVTIA